MRLLGPLLAVLLVFGACGGDRSGGPTGSPTSIVESSPALTLAQRTAKVQVAITKGTAVGTVNFATGKAKLKVTPPGASLPEFTDPAVAVDVVKAAVSVVVFGGIDTRGASTIKYQLDVAPSPELLARLKRPLHARTFYADVNIDAQHRIREVAYPLDLDEPRPDQAHQILAKVVTVDFYDFGTKAG